MHCWRHKTPLVYRATAQWFVGMDRRRRRRLAPCASARCARSRQTKFVPGLGPGAPARDDRQPPRLVHLAPAQLGRADPVLPAQGDRRAASAHRRADGSGRPARGAGRHRGLVQARRRRAARRRGRAVRQDQRHPRRLVRLRHHPQARAARLAQRRPPGRPARRPVPGRLGPAPRLVPLLAAHRLRDRRPRALPQPAHPRLRGGWRTAAR